MLVDALVSLGHLGHNHLLEETEQLVSLCEALIRLEIMKEFQPKLVRDVALGNGRCGDADAYGDVFAFMEALLRSRHARSWLQPRFMCPKSIVVAL